MTVYVLTLFFTCAQSCGGSPPSVAVDPPYQTMVSCNTAGRSWVSPPSNPQGALRGWSCKPKQQ